MTPNRVPRRTPVAPGDTSWRAHLRRKWPWPWWCQIPGCDDREPWDLNFGCAATQPAAGLAHLAEHPETT